MRKLLTFVTGSLITGSLLAGGLVTNTNQSASWVRLPARNASVGIDAVYYNPAGLMKLENGLHFSVSNQTIFQTKEVENFYSGPGGAFGLNESLYTGKVKAPVFPSVYAAYKMDKLAFSFGFNPVGGGAGALYEEGLPSFEMSVSDLVPAFVSMGATEYSLDAYLEGTSVFFGFQGGVSYKINDIFSVAAGLRYVTAKNTYLGHLQDVQLNIGGNWVAVPTFLNGIITNLTGIIGIPNSLAGAIAGGFGGATLADLVSAGFMTAGEKAGIEAGLEYIGLPPAAIPAMDLNTISGTVTTATPTLQATRATAAATSTLVSDQSADVSQTGSGITPFFSVNISPSDNLNIGIKYEMATKLELKNKTAIGKDLLIGFTAEGVPIKMFPDGALTRNDMPALLAVGIDFKPVSDLKISLGSNYYFDKAADYGHKLDQDQNSSTPSTFVPNSDIIDQNGFSIQGGLEYNLSDNFLVSGGYVFANKGVNSLYQSDLTYGLSGHTVGAGGAFSISDNFQINFGASYTNYIKDEQTINHVVALGVVIPALETYNKKSLVFGVGIDLSF